MSAIWLCGNLIGLALYILSFVNLYYPDPILPKHLEPLLSNDMLPIIEVFFVVSCLTTCKGFPALALLLLSNAALFPFKMPTEGRLSVNIQESYGTINSSETSMSYCTEVSCSVSMPYDSYDNGESSSLSFDLDKHFSNYTIMSQLSAFSSTGSGCRVLLVKLGNRYE